MEDCSSARQREIAVKDKTPAVVGTVTLVSFFAYISAVTFWTDPILEERMNFINLALGWLGGVATSVVTYYFGSSAGSRLKDNLLGAK